MNDGPLATAAMVVGTIVLFVVIVRVLVWLLDLLAIVLTCAIVIVQTMIP